MTRRVAHAEPMTRVVLGAGRLGAWSISHARRARMNVVQAVVLGVVEGFAEFLRGQSVSSKDRCEPVSGGSGADRVVGRQGLGERPGARQARRAAQKSLLDVLVTGVAQCAALVPGMSRSGATIGAGLVRAL
jgi:hypothetical protein